MAGLTKRADGVFAAVAGAALALLAGCTAASTSVVTGAELGAVRVVTGTVQGKFVMEGGPVAPDGTPGVAPETPGVAPEVPLRGTVTFRDSRGHTFSVAVGQSGTFTVQLAAGTYRASGRSPQDEQGTALGAVSDPPCSAPLSARVRAGQTDRITLICYVG
jgi:hypothetical protein